MKIEISSQRCRRCGLCVRACPAHLFHAPGAHAPAAHEAATHEADPPSIPTAAGCIACGHCVALCPADAIVHDAFPPEKLAPSEPASRENLAAMWETFERVVASRRSVRIFRSEPIARDELERVLHAAQLAPTACNARQVYWTVVTNPDRLAEVRRLTLQFLEKSVAALQSLPASILSKIFPNGEIAINRRRLPMLRSLLEIAREKDIILYDAPCMLVAHYSKFGGRFADIDAQLAIQNATLAAVAQGLGTFYTGFVTRAADSDRAIARALEIPQDHKIAGGMTLGHPAAQYRYTPLRETPPVAFLD
ncbi:MAG: nitroreductase family protein [Planctomycetia bacterium]|nr:nitroreductase family protein [Planctomycetia bacterium]